MTGLPAFYLFHSSCALILVLLVLNGVHNLLLRLSPFSPEGRICRCRLVELKDDLQGDMADLSFRKSFRTARARLRCIS
ncbi:hypothetical protein BX666DRAFT_225816 [Dichotomocladium elegans]|nr:hypothetical protein BX666DRAFT_225816 [Dichotomocladium elegans]